MEFNDCAYAKFKTVSRNFKGEGLFVGLYTVVDLALGHMSSPFLQNPGERLKFNHSHG